MSALDPSYIRSIRDGIINGNIEANNQDALPDGLVGLYDKELFPPTMKWKERKETLNFFLVFAIAQKEISADFASTILGDEWFNLHNDDESKEEKRLQKVNDLIQLHSKRFNSAGGGKYRLYHERFRLYVLQKVSEQDIAQFNDKFITLCETALEKTTEKDIQEKESYALEFISTHYFISAMEGETECLNKEQAAALKKHAYDQQFWERQIKASKGFEWSKRMLNEMMAWASKFNEDDEVIECALNKVDLYHQEQNDAPRIVQLVADGDIETALERIEKFGGEDKEGLQRKFILYMLCLMELTLLDSKDRVHAKRGIEKILRCLDIFVSENRNDLTNFGSLFSSYWMFEMALKWEIMQLNYLFAFEIYNYIGLDEFSLNITIEQLDILYNVSNIKTILNRDDVLNLIAIQYSKLGDAEKALDIANKIIGDYSKEVKDFTFQKIAINLCQQGEVYYAFDVISKINLIYIKRETIEEIFSLYITQINLNDSLLFLYKLNDNYSKSIVLQLISLKLASEGKVNLSIKILERISDSEIKTEALSKLSIQLVTNGKTIKALEIVEKINDDITKFNSLKKMSLELIKINKIKMALNIVSIIDDIDIKNKTRSLISLELMSKGKILEAFDFVNEISEIRLKKYTQNKIYAELSKSGNLNNEPFNNFKYSPQDLEFEIGEYFVDALVDEFENMDTAQNKYSSNYENFGIFRIGTNHNDFSPQNVYYSLLKILSKEKGIIDLTQKACNLLLISKKYFSDNNIKYGETLVKMSLNVSLEIRDLKNLSLILKQIFIVVTNKQIFDNSVLHNLSSNNLFLKGAFECAKSLIFAKDGDYSNSLKVANEIDHLYWKDYAFLGLSNELKIKKKLIQAYEATQNIINEIERINSLTLISDEWYYYGNSNYADRIIEYSLKSIKEMDDLFLFDLEDIKFLIIKSLSNQKKTSKAIELSNSIIDTKNKILAEFYISRSYSELGKSNSLFEKCIENTLALSTIDLKCNILSELAIQLTLFGNYDSIEFLVNEIPNLQDKLNTCYKIGKIMLDTEGYNQAMNRLNIFKQEDTKIHLRNGIINGINLSNLNNNIFLDVCKYSNIEISFLQDVLQCNALNQLFFSNLPKEKLDRYNRTLNLQWAIDIKNQLPN